MAYSPPDSSLHGIFQARILEWVAISFSRGFSQPRDQTHVSCNADHQVTWEGLKEIKNNQNEETYDFVYWIRNEFPLD